MSTKSPAKSTASAEQRRLIGALFDHAGPTYAKAAGIRLRDTPAPLWQLLVLTNLLSARISADIAVAAARELFAAGGTTAKGMAGLTWQQRVDALGRGHYVRYDESTSSRLGDCADLAQDEYSGDLRRLAGRAGHDPETIGRLLREFKGIGPSGVTIFFREAQAVWPFLRPQFDKIALDGARRLGLPAGAGELSALVPGDDLAIFSAALVRVSRDHGLADTVTSAARSGR